MNIAPRSRPIIALLPTVGLLLAGCGEVGPQGPPPGTPEWYWEAAVENLGSGDFAKTAEHLESIVKSADAGELKNRAALWRTAVLNGLIRGNMELAEAYRQGIDANSTSASAYQNRLQQRQRYARQSAVAFAESLGQVEGAITGEAVSLDFPFPAGAAARSPVLDAVEKGEVVPEGQLNSAVDHTLRRGQILAASEFAGFPDAANQARTTFQAGPVNLPSREVRMTVAKLLLDASVVFDRKRVNQPDIRKILIDRAEQWSKFALESEDEEFKARGEEFQKEIEDERLDMSNRRRKLNKRG